VKLLISLFLTLSFGLCLGQRAEQLFEAGENAYQSSRFTEAVALFDSCLHSKPGYAEAYFARALAKERLNKLDAALTDMNIYLDMVPNDTEALFTRGTLRFQLEKYAQAKEDFLKLTELSVRSTSTVFYQKGASPSGKSQLITTQGNLKPLLFSYIGMTETKLKNFKSAIQWLDSALQLDNNNADYYVNRGIAKEGLNDPTALDDYQKALTIKPDHAVALNNIAVLKRTTGAPVADELEQAIDSDSSMLYPYLERAYQRVEGGYYRGALEDYSSALKINDQDPEIWFARGSVKEKMNDLKGAYSDYTKAINLKENYQQAWLNRANVLSKQGKYAEAVEDYTATLVFSPEYGAAYYNRALAYDKLKKSTEACSDLTKAESLGFTVDGKVKTKLCGN